MNEFIIRKGFISKAASSIYSEISGATVFDVQGTLGQLFSVTDNLTGDIFSVSDISGIPIFNVNSNGLSTFDDSVLIGTVTGQTESLLVGGNIWAHKHITSGGTASDFTKGDGTLDPNTYALASTIYTDSDARASISETVVGLDYNNVSGVFSTTAGYGIPTTTKQTNWDAGYNDKINSAAFNTTNGVITLTQQDAGTVTVDIDGRYALSGDLIPNTDDYIISGSFNTSNGEVTLTRLSGGTVVYDLDGRYALSGGTGSDDYVDSGAFNTSTGDLTLTRLSGGTVVTNLDDRYSLTGHSHSGIGVWQVITTNTTAVENGKYITNSGSRLVITLPTTNNLETIRIIGRGVGGWQIDVPNTWSLLFVDETITDNIQSTEISDSVELMSNGNNTYQVISSTGNITFNNL